MPNVLPQYKTVVDELSPMLVDLPFKIIGIDGPDGSGKTTLGRYIAWHFNISLVETDLSLIIGRSSPGHCTNCISNAVEVRKMMNRPVILEGCAILDLTEKLGISLDFHIYVETKQYEGSDRLSNYLKIYREKFDPKGRANIQIEISP